MSQTEKYTPKLFILPIIIASILFISIAKLPYGFYTFMRVVVPLLSAIYLFFTYLLTDEFRLMMIPNILIVILWNPIFPVYMEKETWVVIDAIFGVCELGIAYYAYRLENPVKQKQSTTPTMSHEPTSTTQNLYLKQYSNAYRKEIVERQISQLESLIEQANDAIKHPEWNKPGNESMEDFVDRMHQVIEKSEADILRLKTGDIALSEEMLKNERWS